MATRYNRLFALSLALTIAVPTAWNAALAADAPAEAAPAAATPAATAAAPATTPAATPASEPAAQAAAPAAEKTAAPAEAQPKNAAEAEEKLEKKSRKKKEVKKGANFEQMERHKGDGYYGSMNKSFGEQHKGDNYEQQQRHQDEGYYTAVPATPKEYPKAPTPPPPVVEPAPVVVAPPPRPASTEPSRKFDDDPGSVGSITYTRHLKSAREFLSSGHHDLAKKHFKEALHILPDQLEVYPGYIDSCQKGNDWSATAAAIEQYIKLDPKKAKEYEWQLGEAWFNLQKWDKAGPMLQKALNNGHHQEQIHRYLLKMAKLQNNNSQVIAEYNALCKIKPGDYKTQLEYAAMLERTGNPQEAIVHYRAATTANPADGPTMGRLAYLLMFHNKDYDGAIAMYQRAMGADPANSVTYTSGIKYCAQQKEGKVSPKKK